MEEEIEIQFVPEITEDINKQQISKVSIDFIINFEDGVLNLNQLEDVKNEFVEMEFYHYAEAVNMAIKCIKVIFVFE